MLSKGRYKVEQWAKPPTKELLPSLLDQAARILTIHDRFASIPKPINRQDQYGCSRKLRAFSHGEIACNLWVELWSWSVISVKIDSIIFTTQKSFKQVQRIPTISQDLVVHSSHLRKLDCYYELIMLNVFVRLLLLQILMYELSNLSQLQKNYYRLIFWPLSSA